MRYFSTFSGIGGFELGIQSALNALELGGRGQTESNVATTGTDFSGKSDIRQPSNCVGFSEIDKYATSIYQKHFPEHKNYGDITKIDATTLPDFDLLVGGFPCQAFSIAGKRGGFDDTRGTLFFDIARILKEKHPRLLFLENVKGLLSHDSGRTFKVILSTLTELGYDLQWQVLNSKNHGVPQNRERVFIIGHLRGTPRPQVFPFGESDSGDTEPQGGSQNEGKRVRGNVASTLAQRDYKGGNNLIQLNQPKHSNDRVYGDKGLSPALNTMQGGNRQPKIVASRGRNPANSSDRTTGAPTEQRLEVNESGTSNTLTNVQKDNWVLEESRIRRLTPTECERLQGFPDGWTEGISDSQRYKCLGNAVTVNVIRDIAEKLLTPIN